MPSTFEKMTSVLRKLGEVEMNSPTNRNGKPSKFKGSVKSKQGDKNINLGLIYLPWNRSIGVDKINQAMQYTEKASMDGAILIGTTFSKSAIEQAYRINDSTNKRILLLDTSEIQAAYDIMQTQDS